MKQTYPTLVLEFAREAALVNFLLTTQEVPEYGPDTDLFQKHLNRIHFRSKRPQRLCVRVQAHAVLVDRLAKMALANGGQLRKDNTIPEPSQELSISRLIRSVMLRTVPTTRIRAGHVLAAFWDADARDLSDHLAQLWELGATGVEVAFLRRRANAPAPSHLVRIHGLRHADAFHGWLSQNAQKVEVYAPVPGERGESRYYVLWGYQFPVPGVERLAGVRGDLVLIRPGEERNPPEWRVFGTGEVDFFRKPYEVVDLEVALSERPLLEIDGEAEPKPVPMELAIVSKSAGGTKQLWQVDREIDRQRRALRDLEAARAQLVDGDSDEVYFAYRFDQHGTDDLNPLLVRMLQQRLGTLAQYSYAFCRPEHDHPYHLIIANRSQQQVGFSLQLADRTYYQPVQWRRWGVNLFLPLGTELAPNIDTNDAIPLLQRFLEQSAQVADDGGGSDEADDPKMWDAVLWQPGLDGAIVETRVRKSVPLLHQFRLLNSFQCRTAREVEQATRTALLETVRAARAGVADDLDALERDLIEFVTARTTDIETRYAEMDASLKKADQLVADLEPRVAKVSDRLGQRIEDWVEFVRSVVRTHWDLNRPALTEYDTHCRLNQEITRGLLKTLTPRGRSLAARAQRDGERLNGHLADFDRARSEALQSIQDVQELGRRTARLLVEASQVHQKLGERIRRLRASEEQVAALQQEIDGIDAREREANERLAQLKEIRAQAEAREVETRQKEGDVLRQEGVLARQLAEIAQLDADLASRGERVSGRLQHIEQQMTRIRAQSDEMERLFDELQEQVELVDAHEGAVRVWQSHRGGWESYVRRKGEGLSRSIEEMNVLTADTRRQHDELTTLEQELNALRERLIHALEQVPSNGNGHA